VGDSREAPQKLKNRTTIRPSNFTVEYLPKENEIINSGRCMHLSGFPAAVFTKIFAKIQRQSKCTSIDEW